MLGCGVLVWGAFAMGMPVRTWGLVALALPAWVLDSVDGWVARRTGTASARGATLDSGVDGALVLVLAVALTPVAPWALVGGLLYPLFLLGQMVRPAWRADLPGGRRGKVVGGILTGTLVIGAAPVWPQGAIQVAMALAVLGVVISFASDIRRLEREGR